jgi:hypothetical protein
MLRQAMLGLTSFATLATVGVWLPRARGEARPITGVADTVETTGVDLIWLPAARGETRASLALTLVVIAVKAAAPIIVRRIRVFIFLSYFQAALHCVAE